jgi:antitoxin FitA
MALIQIRDVPEDVYETIRRRARRNGQSIQKYMLAQITEAARQDDLDEVIAEIEEEQRRSPPLVIDVDQLLADRDSGRP